VNSGLSSLPRKCLLRIPASSKRFLLITVALLNFREARKRETLRTRRKSHGNALYAGYSFLSESFETRLEKKDFIVVLGFWVERANYSPWECRYNKGNFFIRISLSFQTIKNHRIIHGNVVKRFVP